MLSLIAINHDMKTAKQSLVSHQLDLAATDRLVWSSACTAL